MILISHRSAQQRSAAIKYRRTDYVG